MFRPNVVTARYNMVFNLLRQTMTQNPNTGQIMRQWTVFRYDVPCIARGVTGGGIRVVGSTERYEGGVYTNIEWVKMQTHTIISKRDRIVDIKERDEPRSNWLEVDSNGDLVPVVFEVLGGTPIQDPFGRLVEYDVLLTRAEAFDNVDEMRQWVNRVYSDTDVVPADDPGTSDDEDDYDWQ